MENAAPYIIGSGALILFVAVAIPLGALLILPFTRMLENAADEVRARSGWSAPSRTGEFLCLLFCIAWLVFAANTLEAFLRQIFTPFSEACFPFAFETLVMPTYMLCWLALGIGALLRPVDAKWLVSAVCGGAVLIAFYWHGSHLVAPTAIT
jgi:hypothetical protein